MVAAGALPLLLAAPAAAALDGGSFVPDAGIADAVAPTPSASAEPEPPLALSLEPSEAVRGARITIHGQSLPAKAHIWLESFPVRGAVETSADRQTTTFWVPRTVRDSSGSETPLPLGFHDLRLWDDKTDREVHFVSPPSGRLVVVPDAAAQFTLLSVQPPILFQEENGIPTMTLHGAGFSVTDQDHAIAIDGAPIFIRWGVPLNSCDDKVCAEFDPSRADLRLRFGVDAITPGRHKITVFRGGLPAELPFTVVCESLDKIKIEAAAVVVLIFGALLVGAWHLLRGEMEKMQLEGAPGRVKQFLYFLLVDPENQTVSLSRLQFYLWSAVSAFACTYVFWIRGLVQGRFDPPDVGSLPGILGWSVGTGVAALGIKTAKGPEGAGRIHPSLRDLITTGGIVAPEKFQFLLWTILGISAFFVATIHSDAASVTQLPTVPEGVLYLMGISSLGYLGGKLARKSGPVIDEIVLAATGGLKLRGQGFSRNASFHIDGVPAVMPTRPVFEDPDGTCQRE